MPKDKSKEFLLGGQAVIEGVMMRSPNYYAVAVRKESGDIALIQRHHPRITDRHKILAMPFIRGLVLLGQNLGIGIKSLNFSADILAAEEAEAKGEEASKSGFSGVTAAISITIAILFAFGLVVFLPLFLTDLSVSLFPVLDHPLAYNAIDGLFRVIFFISYILLISFIPDILRVFQYHGAEHMSVYASERDDEITVETSQKHSPYHPRCGTSFLLLVMIVAIVVFSFTPTKAVFWTKLLIRTPLIPLIAGVSYELLRITSKLNSHRLFSFLSAPGMWLQRLTAKKPDSSQLAVAVLALNKVIKLEEDFQGQPLPPSDLETQTISGH